MKQLVRGFLWVVMLFAVVTAMWHYRVAKHDQTIPWNTDLTISQQQAVKSGKPLLLEVSATWCSPCQRMNMTTLRDPEVVRLLHQYVLVSIDFDNQPKLVHELNITSIPCFFVADARTGRILRENRAGLLAPKDFCDWLTHNEEQ